MCVCSARTLYNVFHAGFVSAYIQNTRYLLLIDFRGVEDWAEQRLATSTHHTRVAGDTRTLAAYSVIVCYDADGTSVGNIRSPSSYKNS